MKTQEVADVREIVVAVSSTDLKDNNDGGGY
jgi:hypothetical protein